MAKDTEIEIKVRVENSQPLLDFLSNYGRHEGERRQVDEYFSPEDARRDFLRSRPVKEWLRLRDAGGKGSINYKYWHHNSDRQADFADEFETAVDSLEHARKMLLALGFKPIVMVDKVRSTWVYQNYEIAIDSVKELGDFIEIEYSGSDIKADPKATTTQMMEFLNEMQCGTITRDFVGYPFLLLFPDEVKS